jgi:hypothetical protein
MIPTIPYDSAVVYTSGPKNRALCSRCRVHMAFSICHCCCLGDAHTKLLSSRLQADLSEFCIVAQDTVIHTSTICCTVRSYPQLTQFIRGRADVDISGCRKQMAQIRELVELPLHHPQLFKSISIKWYLTVYWKDTHGASCCK